MSPWSLRKAAMHLHAGGLVVYPTAAVWGIGCDPRQAKAVEKLLIAKQRSPDKGLILLAADWAQLEPWLTPGLANKLPDGFDPENWPPHTTLLLPAHRHCSALVSGGRERLAVRITHHKPSRALCEAFGGPIVSTSANLSGRPCGRHLWQARKQLGSRVDYYWNAPLGQAGGPSRILDPYSQQVLRT